MHNKWILLGFLLLVQAFVHEIRALEDAGLELEAYAVHEMDLMLNHVIYTASDVVTKYLVQVDHSQGGRDHLKRCMNAMREVLREEVDGEDEVPTYASVQRKLEFVQSELFARLDTHLPEDYRAELRRKRDEMAHWVDKKAETMRGVFDKQTREEDPLRNNYFNSSFDDLPMAHTALEKIQILAEMTRTIVLKTPVNFLDLYMHSPGDP